MKKAMLILFIFFTVICPGKGITLDRDDCKKLFKGKILSAKSASREVVLGYDYSDKAQLKDFAGLVFYKEKGFYPGGMTTPSWHKASFDGDVTINARIFARGGMCTFFLQVDPVKKEGYVFMFGLNDKPHTGRSFDGVALFREGQEPQVLSRGILGVFKPKSYDITVVRKGDLLQLSLDGRIIIKAHNNKHNSGKIGFAGDYLVEKLQVRGRLNARWCEKTLSGKDGDSESDHVLHHMGVPAWFKPRKDLPDWKAPYRKDTAHYEVMSSVNQDFTDHFARCAEAMHGMFSSFFSDHSQGPKSRVVIFKDHAEYRQFGGPRLCQGFYCPRNKILYLYNHMDPEIPERVLLCEGLQQYLDKHAANMPLWFRDGMASYFETAKLVVKGSKTRFKTGGTGDKLIPLKQAIKRKRDIFIKDFITTKDGAFNNIFKKAANARHAWGVCHFFIHNQNGKYLPHFKKYVNSIQYGIKPEDAIRVVFASVNWRKVHQAWQDYILGLD